MMRGSHVERALEPFVASSGPAVCCKQTAKTLKVYNLRPKQQSSPNAGPMYNSTSYYKKGLVPEDQTALPEAIRRVKSPSQ